MGLIGNRYRYVRPFMAKLVILIPRMVRRKKYEIVAGINICSDHNAYVGV